MSTFCSANQGAEESLPGETFPLFIISVGFGFPYRNMEWVCKSFGLEYRRKEKVSLSDLIWRDSLAKCPIGWGKRPRQG